MLSTTHEDKGTSVEFCECPIPSPGRDKFCKTCFKVVSEKGMATAAAHIAAMTATPSGVPGNGMRVFGIILSVGGLLFAISPLIAVAVGCAGSSDSSCGAGAIVMMFTVPVGGLAAAIGSVLVAIGSSRRNKALAASRSAMTSTAVDGSPRDEAATAPTLAPAGTNTRPARKVPSVRAGQIFIGVAIALFTLGVFITPHRGAGAQGFYSAVSPIDCWWLAVLCAVVGAFIVKAHSRQYSPDRFWGRTFVWCGVVVLSWNFFITLLMGSGAGIGEYINQALDPGDGEPFSPLGILTGSSGGYFISMFPGVILGSFLLSRGNRFLKTANS